MRWGKHARGGGKRVGAIVLAGMAMSASGGVLAQAPAAYPTKPIRLIVPYPPGAGTDFTARALGERITEALGQQVVIDSRPGAGATLGHGLVARAAPDGYTLLLATTGGMVSGPALGVKLTYDPLKDFAAIGIATYVPYSLVTFGGLPPNNMREFIAFAKTQPGKLNFGSSGTGTPNHVGGVLLMKMTGIDMLHVPYKGGGPMLTDLIAGQMHVGVTSLPTVLPHVPTGRLKVLGVGFIRRIKSAPDIPTIAETVPGYNNTGWWGLVAPLGTPQPIIQKLNEVLNKGMQSPAMVRHFVNNGLEPATSTPAAFQEIIASDLQLWRKLIKDANISVNAL
jgi:tripartite-type tricarboxylate transporter receptor subunit TctC